MLTPTLIIPSPHLLVLPQAGTRSAGQVVVWVIILSLVVAFGGILVFWLRKRMLADDPPPAVSDAIMLNQLRKSRDRGDISEQQFRNARERLLEGLSGRVRARAKPLRGEIYADGTIRARPGFDLLGDPLPPTHPDQPPDGSG